MVAAGGPASICRVPSRESMPSPGAGCRLTHVKLLVAGTTELRLEASGAARGPTWGRAELAHEDKVTVPPRDERADSAGELLGCTRTGDCKRLAERLNRGDAKWLGACGNG